MAESTQQDVASISGSAEADVQLNGKKRDILLLCSEELQRFSDIARTITISESGLAKNLNSLTHAGLITRLENGYYTATPHGLERAKQLRREDDVRRQKLARKLLALQNLVSPKELIGFENVQALLGRRRHGPHAYEALAVVSAFEIAYLTECILTPTTEIGLYEQALQLLRRLPDNISLTIRFNLEEGYRMALRQLMNDVDQGLAQEKTLEQFRQKDGIFLDIRERFLR